MSWLALNGISLNASVDKTQHALEVLARGSATSGGLLVSDVRAAKRSWSVTTPPLPIEEALFIRDVVQGRHDVWSFDADFYSAQGRAAVDPAPGQWTISATRSKWGTNSLRSSNSASQKFTIQFYGAGLTLAFWVYSVPAVLWSVELHSWTTKPTGLSTSNPAYSKNITTAGVVGASILSTLPTINSSGTVALPSGADCSIGQYWVSDLWTVGRSVAGIDTARLESNWLPGLGTVTAARGASPRLMLAGTNVGRAIEVLGEPSGAEMMPVLRGGVLQKTNHQLAFSLFEV